MTKVYNLDGTVKAEIKLPKVFLASYRPDLIQRAVLALHSSHRQPYGTDPLAGKRTSAHYHGVKDTRYSMKNREIARMPRSHNTSPAQEWRVRFVPHSRSGRQAHPPKTEKVFALKINEKENKGALVSAIAATGQQNLVALRGHKFSGELPLILADDLENISKAKDVVKMLSALKLDEEIVRAKQKKIRAGRGKMRGRKYRRKKSILFVVLHDCALTKACRNFPGTDIAKVLQLNAEMLAPGAQAGRLVVWSESAIKHLGEIYG